jgi:hypothetical protein
MDTTSPGGGLRLGGLIVGGVGLVLAIAGAFVAIYSAPAITARHAALEALPSPDAVVLTDTPPGVEILIEGHIAGDQPVLFRNFVAFVKEEEQRGKSDDDPTEWKVRERQAPPLHIQRTEDESIRVVNFAYGLWGARTIWRDESKTFDTRYTGLVSGEAVVVHGRTAAGGIEAIEVASGSRASYLATVAGNADRAWWLGVGLVSLGSIMSVAGTSLLITGVLRLRAFRRRSW